MSPKKAMVASLRADCRLAYSPSVAFCSPAQSSFLVVQFGKPIRWQKVVKVLISKQNAPKTYRVPDRSIDGCLGSAARRTRTAPRSRGAKEPGWEGNEDSMKGDHDQIGNAGFIGLIPRKWMVCRVILLKWMVCRGHSQEMDGS